MHAPLEQTYAHAHPRFAVATRPTPVRAPSLLGFNHALAAELGLDAAQWTSPEGVAVLAGNAVLEGVEPVALAYAGHQFGHFVPQLGDGRALLLGEVVTPAGRRVDVQLKGAGPTPFSRNGDGRAALGPVLREYVVSEAMAALGIPTTRALSAVATGDRVWRSPPAPGAVLCRVAASHLRVGTFEFFAARGDTEALGALVEYALGRHYPTALADRPGDPAALVLLDAVVSAQAALVARWLAVGFVHGVMNTDNCAISGETLDYGPCAFMDAFDPGRTFSSIDHNDRYAYAKQPSMALWNLSRLAESLLPLIDADSDRAVARARAVLEQFMPRFGARHTEAMCAKLGRAARETNMALVSDLLAIATTHKLDFTGTFAALTEVAAGGVWTGHPAVEPWLRGWLDADGAAPDVAQMRQANPLYIPRNHAIEAMIAAATEGDMGPFERLNRVLANPHTPHPEAGDLATPPGDEQWEYVTFCGT